MADIVNNHVSSVTWHFKCNNWYNIFMERKGKNEKMIKQKKLHITGLYMLRRRWRLGLRFA
jgi:hypothetical protein